MRGLRHLLIFALALACKPTDETKTPEDTSALERMEKGPGATPEGATPAVDADDAAKKAAAQKVLAKVRDRDPEEEKRKLAQSRQRSAQARKMLQGGRFDEAVANARAALKIHEQNVDAMLVLAEVFFREKKYELTVSVTGTALAVDEKIRTPRETSVAYNLQGFALASMGQNQRATKAFKKAAEADDKNAAAWNNLGTRYLRGGDVKTAAQCFSYAIELAPGFAKAHLNYGAALRSQGKWVAAEKEFQQALKLKKTYPEAYFNLGLLYLDADPFPELSTVQRLNKAILYLEKYKGIATDVTSEPVPKGVGNKKDLAPVSRARADDYIRVAQKGLDREARRTKRDQERAQKKAAGGDGAEGEGGAEPADEPGGSSPQKPGGSSPQKPGGSSPQKPGTTAPQKPGTTAPQKPAPTPPTKPSAPAPKPDTPPAQKPPAQKPPSTSPTQKPPTTAPTQKPGAPPPQSPSDKPGVQRPAQKNSAAWNPRGQPDTKYAGAAFSLPPKRAWHPNVQGLPTGQARGHTGREPG
jgi:tetratricopeptide (TPR) repeat protein